MSLNWTIKRYACVKSTQDLLKEQAVSGAQEGLVICAQEQSQGRGRHGNAWIAPKGNLYMSFLLRPECEAIQAGHYSFLMAVALSKTIDLYMGERHVKHLKWPNDVLIDGKKCAGILLESTLSPEGKISELYIGVGVNILTPPEGKISIQQASSHDMSVDLFLNQFLVNINEYIDLYDKNGFKNIYDIWIQSAYKLGEEITVRLPHKTLYGVFEGLDQEGTLLLRCDDQKLKRITAGEIYF